MLGIILHLVDLEEEKCYKSATSHSIQMSTLTL